MNTKISADAGSIKRGVVILKLLATAGYKGLALTEVSSKANLPHPSAHRLLAQLISENLVVHNSESRRYRLGPLTFELGIAGSTMYDIRDICEPSMLSLARETEDTVYLVVRSGFDAVCMHRVEGSYPIRTLVLEVGSRRPLGVGAGGLAILAAISEEDRNEIIERVTPNLSEFGKLSNEALKESCDQASVSEIAVVQNRVSLGVTAVGIHFCDTMRQPIGALSVAALTQRMSTKRISSISAQLKTAKLEVEQKLRSKNSPRKK